MKKTAKYTLEEVERDEILEELYPSGYPMNLPVFLLLDEEGCDVTGEFGPLEMWLSYNPVSIERMNKRDTVILSKVKSN